MQVQVQDVFDNILGVTMETYAQLLKCGADAERLYMFYVYTSKKQGQKRIYCTTGFCAKGLDICERRIRAAKEKLKEYGLIQDITTKGADGKVKNWYVEITYLLRKTTLAKMEGVDDTTDEELKMQKNHPVHFARGGKSERQIHKAIQSKIHKENAQSQNAPAHVLEEVEKKEDDNFLLFWNAYPRKVDRKKAITAWWKLKKTAHSEVLAWLAEWCKLWDTFSPAEKQYIPYAQGFLNNARYSSEVVQAEVLPRLSQIHQEPKKKTEAEALQQVEVRKQEIRTIEAQEDREAKRRKEESEAIMQYFGTLESDTRQEIIEEVSESMSHLQSMIASSPKSYETLHRAKIVSIVRPMWERRG